jgi:dinuclear metal center YbgI/SA1388 family protein
MRVKEITSLLDRKFPLKLQEQYDNAGAQLVFADEEATGVLLALDATPGVAREAEQKKCNLIITHHPFFFRPVKKIIDTEPRSSLLLKLAAGRVSVYSSHTNLDKVYHDKLAETLGFTGGTVLLESEDKSAEGSIGLGARIDLAEPVSLEDLLARVKKLLGLEFLVYCGDLEASLKRIAFLNGAGGGSIDRVLALHGPQCIVTGDVGYHHIQGALDRGVAVIDAGHFGTERIYLPFLKNDLEEMMRATKAREIPGVIISESEKNPFLVFH